MFTDIAEGQTRWYAEHEAIQKRMSLPRSRAHLEALLQARRLEGTLAGRVPATGVLSTGLAELDTTLGGGWPRGHVSEIVGPASSGRTRVLVSTLASATARGDVAAWIDTVDRGDPAGAAAAGVRLSHVLWVRGMPLSPGVLALRPRRGDPDLTHTVVQRAIKAAHLVAQASRSRAAPAVCPCASRGVPAGTARRRARAGWPAWTARCAWSAVVSPRERRAKSRWHWRGSHVRRPPSPLVSGGSDT